VFGPDRPSFIDQILKRAKESPELSAIADKWAVPTYTLDAARWLRPLLGPIPVPGVIHLCNGGSCTWQEYGQFAVDCLAQRGVPLRGRAVAPLKLAEMKAFIAERPVYTVMSNAKLASLIGETPRPWKEAVAEYVSSGGCVAAQ
jgi:dTDP-4-dehydrorhamnose reductase